LPNVLEFTRRYNTLNEYWENVIPIIGSIIKIKEGKYMKRTLYVLLSLLLIITLLAGCSGGQPAAKEEPASESTEEPAENTSEEPRKAAVSFATSGQGGTFYVAGSGIASITSTKVDGLEVTAEVTKGVVENARLMASDQTEMGFAYGSTAYSIQRGINEFEGQKYEGLRAVASIHTGALNFVTLEKSDIRTIDDLVGKKVSIGPQGSGSAAVSEEFFRSADMFDKVDIQYLSFNDSADSLRDGHIDAFVIGGTTPVPALIELEASNKLFFIPVDDSKIEKFLSDYPYHVSYTIPAGGYTSVAEPVKTVGYSVIWVAREDVPDWVIHDMLEVVFSDEGGKYLQNVQLAFREMAPGIEIFDAIELPLHPGAEAYYKEKGLLN
jgi:TRAP transporter TAXI family solute receptor